MISLFTIAAILLLLTMLPGAILCRAVGTNWTWACILSPITGLALLTCICQAYAIVGVKASPISVFAPALLIPLFTFITVKGKIKQIDLPRVHPIIPIIYIVIGLLLAYNLFASRIGSPDALFQAYDVTWHINVIQGFIDSGKLTCLGVGPYLSAPDTAIAPVNYSGFYPTAWHMLCALAAMASHATVPTVINASMIAFTGIIFPLSILALISCLFPNNKHMALCGALVCLAFVAFPWFLLVFGPIYSNFAGFCLVPAAMSMFIFSTRNHAKPSERVRLFLLLALGTIGMALCQPNTVFTCVLLLTPYCVTRIYNEIKETTTDNRKAITGSALFALFIIAFWFFCYRLPFLQPTVTHVWKAYAWTWQEIVNILTLQYTFGFCYETAAQYALGTLVIIGFVCVLYKPGKRWISASYCLACFALIVASTRSDEFKQFIAGFWYTDPMRLASVCAIAAIPLAAVGSEWIYQQVLNLCIAYNNKKQSATNNRLIACTLSILLIIVNFMPGFNLAGLHRKYTDEEYKKYYKMEDRDRPNKSFHTTYGDFREVISDTYRLKDPLDSKEKAFLDKVQQEIPKGSVVINDPMDGSFLAYGTNGIRVYYRNFVGFGSTSETKDSRAIRTNLASYKSDTSVKKAVDNIDARYVLTMHGKKSQAGFIDLRKNYKPKLFKGVAAITKDTPGFKLVLESRGMALYEIER